MYGMSGVIAFVSEFLCTSDSDSLYALNELPIRQTLRMLFPQLDHIRPLYRLKPQWGMKKRVLRSTTRFASSL